MAEDVAVVKDEPSANSCCTEWKKQYSKLQEKYSKLELRRNALREGISMVNEKFDLIEEENKTLKQVTEEALENLKVQVSKEKDEKEKESSKQVSLVNEVSTLKAEILLLQKNGNSVAQEEEGAIIQLRECLAAAGTEIEQLNKRMDKERARADAERKNAEMEKKKAEQALKKINAEKEKVTEAKTKADTERKKAEESRMMFEKLKAETEEVKSKLALEMSKTKEANKKVETERQITTQERKRADLAVAKADEQRKIAEMNMKKAMDEKGQAEQLSQKLVEERTKIERLEKDMHEHVSSRSLVKSTLDISERQITAGNVEGNGDHCLETMMTRGLMNEELEKKLAEREHVITREKRRADLETKKAEKQKKIAKALRKESKDEKQRADKLSRDLEDSKQREGELQKELLELVSCRKFTNSPLSAYNTVISETATAKLLKKQLKFEKKLVKHAKEVARVEIGRNNVLRLELFQLKQEALQFQQRLDVLNDAILHRDEGIDKVEKIGNLSLTRMHSVSNPHQKQCNGKNELLAEPCSRASTAVMGSESLKQNIECTTSLRPSYLSGISNRKMLQSSAINSSSASFSDRPFMGSQERGDISVTTSAKLLEDKSNLEPIISRLSGETRKRCNQNFAATADDSVRSPIKGNDTERRYGHCKKRKQILDAAESMEKLHSKNQKLHWQVSEKLSVLHGILHGQKDECPEENLQGNSFRKHVMPYKQRMSSCEEPIANHPIREASEAKSMIDNFDDKEFDFNLHALPPVCNLTKADRGRKDGMGNILTNNQDVHRDFEELAEHGHMKLLDLDNDVDEKTYQEAIAAPLSPSLPEIELWDDGSFQIDNPTLLLNESFYNRMPNIKNNMAPICSFNVVGTEVDSNKLEHDGFGSSQLQKNEDHADSAKIPAGREDDGLDLAHASNDSVIRSQDLGTKLRISNESNGGKMNSEHLTEIGVVSAWNAGLKYAVIFSDNSDSNSICRILQTTIKCYMSQPSLLHSPDSFSTVLLALLKAEGLFTKEKVCVFFSLLLHGISEFEMNLVDIDSVLPLDSFAGHLHAVLSDMDLRMVFMQSCNWFELLALIEDFLLERKVLVNADLSSESMLDGNPGGNLVLNGNAKMISVEAAPSHLLVAGGILLASLCTAVDYIGFVCEISCNIFMVEKFDPSVVLTILHVFAHICGSKYFNLEQYGVVMTVVKSVVMLLENQNFSTKFTSFPSLVGSLSKIQSCCKCPFSEGAVSMDVVVSLLLDKLQTYAGAGVWSKEPLELVNLLIPGLLSHKEKAEDVLDSGEAVLSSSKCDEISCSSIDVLSLFELVALCMGWDWACDNVICQLWDLLEACVVEHFSIPIIILLGQLGRLGVNTNGHEDAGVEKLRSWLSALLCRSASPNSSLPVQFAIADALLGVIPVNYEVVIENEIETPAVTSQSVAANCIRKWFFLLNSEQKSSFKLQQAARMTNCKTGSLSKQLGF